MTMTCPSNRLRQNILGAVGNAAQNTPLPKQILIMPKTITEGIEVGSFYEIDRSMLPPTTPARLHSVRVVMVTAKTELSVTVRYPSTESLEAYFNKVEYGALRSKLYPALDEKYVMGPGLATKVLGRQIPSQEFVQLRHSDSFWLPLSVRNSDSNGKKKNHPACLLELFEGKIKGWGFQRTVAYVQSPKQRDNPQEETSVFRGDGEERREKEEETQHEGKGEKGIIQYSRKRKRGRPLGSHGKKRKSSSKESKTIEVKAKVEGNVNEEGKSIERCPSERYEEAGKAVQIKTEAKKSIKKEGGKIIERWPAKRYKAAGKTVQFRTKAKKKVKKEGGNSTERWPAKRYDAAAKELSEILKANRAVYGNTISRGNLREEARKRIGDTGLLDHLLKHLVGQVVPPGGKDRLRRRCDAEGKMEYWLESADLDNIRKQAGVQDPYWTPPPGWKPGDCITSSGCLCYQQVKQLKDEVISLKRQLVEVKSNKDGEDRAMTVKLPDCVASSERRGTISKEELYKGLLKKKAMMEEQIVQVSKSLTEIKEAMKMLAEEAESNKSLPADEDEMMRKMSEEGGEERENRQGKRKMIVKLKQCSSSKRGGLGDNSNTSNIAAAEEEEIPAEDGMALTPATASPTSTTTA